MTPPPDGAAGPGRRPASGIALPAPLRPVGAYVSAVRTGDPGRLGSDMATSLASHRVVWAAEHARLYGSVVTL